MELSPADLGLGLLLSLAVAWAAYRKKSLSVSGLYAAVVLGTLIYLLGGLLFWAILILFFISSSLLSKFRRKDKVLIEQDFAKTGNRDWLQVLANGAVGLGFAAAWRVTGDSLFAVGYIATFATVNADTWATEIGILSSRPPVGILTFKPVTPGASGAISFLGTSAALAGAIFIALVSGLGLMLTDPGSFSFLLVLAGGISGGIFGCLTDSLLGATVQAAYRCPVCGKLTERKIHHQQTTQLVRGFRFFHNDMVNLASSLLGGLLAMIVVQILS